MRTFESNCVAPDEIAMENKEPEHMNNLDEKTRDRLQERQDAIREGMREAFVYYHGKN